MRPRVFETILCNSLKQILKKPRKIIILSGNPLCHNPRVLKEAEVLTEAGHEVEILTSGRNPALLQRDRHLASGKKWKIQPLMTKLSSFEKFGIRAKRRLGNLAHRWLRLENPWQLGEMANLLYRKAKESDAVFFIAHSEPGMWAADRLLKEGESVGVDMEDWFSEDLLPEARKERPLALLKRLEKNLLCHGAAGTCTSEAMADALVSAYGCRRPTVIQNVFPVKDRETMDGKWKDRPGMAKWMPSNDPDIARPQDAPVSIHWFSQTIGPGRGLEILLRALDGVNGNWELHLRGNLKGYEGWLERACPASVKDRLKLHGLVENEELLSRISEHDIGYAGEEKMPPSRNLTITNKLFQYLQGGLATVASDTAGQMEAAKEAEGAIRLYQAGNPDSLRTVLVSLLGDRSHILRIKKNAWEAGAQLSWENEARKYRELTRQLERN